MKFLNFMSLASGVTALAIPSDSSNDLVARDISQDTKWTSDSQFKSSILKRSNDYRRAHGVKELVWDDTLADFADQFLNKDGAAAGVCPSFAHSDGPYGENLAIGYSTPRATVSVWGDEREDYDWSNPGFAGSTGHFTQLVWKDTTKMGCQRKFCSGDNGIRGWYVVCEYSPRGNMLGQFEDQVLQNGYNPPSKKVRSIPTNDKRSWVGQGASALPPVFTT